MLLLISSPWKSLRRKPTSEWRFTRSRSRLSQLTAKLKQAEEFAERSVQKLQKERGARDGA